MMINVFVRIIKHEIEKIELTVLVVKGVKINSTDAKPASY